ncbi:hypothetical protein CYMTET_28599, partial [Cymbomonas tetramitiformis]
MTYPRPTPPQDNDTRSGWGGAYHQALWYFNNQVAVQMYDVESPTKAANAVPNPDGSVYRNHQLMLDEWDVRVCTSFGTRRKPLIDLLQSTLNVTANLFLPVIGRMVYTVHADTPLKFDNEKVSIMNENVIEARELMYRACCSRWFNSLMDCKLEDFVVATMLDPRYKSFKFKYAGRWMRGRLTLKQAETWLANAFEADWKPKGPVEEDERPAKKMKSGPTERTSVASFLMCDSDEEDAVEDAAAEECEVEELDEVHS